MGTTESVPVASPSQHDWAWIDVASAGSGQQGWASSTGAHSPSGQHVKGTASPAHKASSTAKLVARFVIPSTIGGFEVPVKAILVYIF